MIPFFFIGSRRSGTTMLRYVLNKNPEIYCSFESGIMLVLHGIMLGKTVEEVKSDIAGEFSHIKLTFDYAKNVFDGYERLEEKSPIATRDAFFEGIDCCRKRRVCLEGKARGRFVAVGEKNPSEYAEPTFNKFIRKVHPDVRFIHLVRHPMGFVQSFLESWTSSYSVADLLELWVEREQWVLDIEKHAPVFTIRYEDLCAAPAIWTKKLYLFLVPRVKGYVVQLGASVVKVNGNDKYELSFQNKVDGLEELISMYGYSQEA